MSSLALNIELRPLAGKALASVFETMLQMPLAPAAEATPLPPSTERVTGCVGFAGEHVNGAIYVHLSSTFARQVVSAMLGLPPEELGEDDAVNDGVGEVCNMVAGAVKSELCDLGAVCGVSTPAIIRGTAFDIETVPGVRREILFFDCQGEPLVLEIHLKLNA